jgi:hypothetical protein
MFSNTQIFEIVNLTNELLPPLPQGTISLPVSTNFVKGPVVKKSPAGSSAQQEDTNGNVPEISAREKLLNEQPELLGQFGMDLLPVLIQVDIYCIDYMNKLCFIHLSNFKSWWLFVKLLSCFLMWLFDN